jgi:hypothetical protein
MKQYVCINAVDALTDEAVCHSDPPIELVQLGIYRVFTDDAESRPAKGDVVIEDEYAKRNKQQLVYVGESYIEKYFIPLP